jgi:pimeloyl-ACP methyl ester carboxylesterase
MRLTRFGAALIVVTFALGGVATHSFSELGRPGIAAAPCPEQSWQESDPTFAALPGATVAFGHYTGGLYRIEIPEKWNGDLVLWSHGYVANSGSDGSRLVVGVPGGGREQTAFRQHLVDRGFAWAASSYRCNGYVPGAGLLDTKGLIDEFTKVNKSKPPARVYLTGGSMGGHITLLGLQEFPRAFAGGLALCASGPGEMDFLASVAAASEFVSGVKVSEGTADADVRRLTDVLGEAKAYTEKGRQLASIQIQISGGPRPFAVEGLAARFIANARYPLERKQEDIWYRVASNADTQYSIDEGLGLTAEAINAHVRRKAAEPLARSAAGPYEEAIPFDGRFERPVMTLHGTGDLYVPISLQRILKRAVDGAGRSSFLVQRIVRSPGHCNFSPEEVSRAFDDLVTWSRTGRKPDGDDVLGDLADAGLKFTEPLRPGDPGTRRP